MPTFNANAAMARMNKKINNLTDSLAFEINERLQDPAATNDEMIAFLKALLKVVRSKDDVQKLIAGNFAQSNSGQPAAQLGAAPGQGGTLPSPSTPANIQDALRVLGQDPRMGPGQKALIARLGLELENPGVTGGIQVDQAGDDLRISQLRQKLTQAENERDAAVQAKADAEAARDQAVADLATARDGWVEKSALLPLVEAVATAAGGLSTSVFSSIVEGKDALDTAVAAAKAAVS